MTALSKTILILGTGECISRELPNYGSRDQVTLAITTVAIPANTVLGKTHGTQAAKAAVARAGNTGNPTFGTIVVPADAPPGSVGITFTDATHFEVEVNGNALGNGVAGTAFLNDGYGFTITAGGTAAVAGDGFDVALAYADDGLFGPLDPAATNGLQNFAGILYERREINTATQRAVALVRTFDFNKNKINLLNALDATQLATMYRQAKAIGCVGRD